MVMEIKSETILNIPGDYLEGGGQILRTAAALSCILRQPIHVFNIRTKRPNPGLKSQHLHTLKTLAQLFQAQTEGIELDSKEIFFSPRLKFIEKEKIKVDLQTAGSIGLFLQPLFLVGAFRIDFLSLEIKGGTCGLGAIPVDYYPAVVFPLLSPLGLEAKLEIIKRGYYPKGGGEVRVEIKKIDNPQAIIFTQQGKITQIQGISIASSNLSDRKVSQRQAREAERILKERYAVPAEIRIEYASTLSSGSEINLYCKTDSGCILWADSRGELKKSAEEVGREAAKKLIREIESGATVDMHLADNLIPWLSLLGGKIKTSEISLHTQTNIWICELFLGKVFNLQDNTISCPGASGNI